MNYSVIKTGGKQYKVFVGQELEVDRLTSESENITFNDVLLNVSDGKVKVGTPLLKGEKVQAKLIEQTKGEKIRVSKYKAKVRYRRVTGFRASLSKVLIEKI